MNKNKLMLGVALIAAGAIVAYAMDITTFDPLENGLMFERFLSPQRSEMPDIDMDFDDERRLEVVEHVRQTQSGMVKFAREQFGRMVEGLIGEDIKALRHAAEAVDDEKAMWKRYRRKEIIGMRKIDYLQAVEKNTWFHLGCNSCSQIIYCLKRMVEPCLEHVDNNFNPLPKEYVEELRPFCAEVMTMMDKVSLMIVSGDFTGADEVLVYGNALKSQLSAVRHNQQDRIQREDSNIKVDLLYLSTLQETQELISVTRHLLRASRRFQE